MIRTFSTETFASIPLFWQQKISTRFLWKEKSTTKASTKQFICFGKIVCPMNFTSSPVNKKTLAT